MVGEGCRRGNVRDAIGLRSANLFPSLPLSSHPHSPKGRSALRRHLQSPRCALPSAPGSGTAKPRGDYQQVIGLDWVMYGTVWYGCVGGVTLPILSVIRTLGQ